jgi:undecaprenyl-diphosphatase
MKDAYSELPDVEQLPTPLSLHLAILGSLAVAIVALLGFVWLAEEVFEGSATRFDAYVRTWVHSYASPALTSAMVAVSLLGSIVLVVVFIVALVVFMHLKWRRAACWLFFSMAGALALDLTLKYAFHRPRPTPFFGSLPNSYSFPSGHALFSFCIYGVLAGLLDTRIRSGAIRVIVYALAVGLIGAIGLSRIYLGVHYPTDVIAGYLAAAVWVSSLMVADRLHSRRKRFGAPANSSRN